jgi:predicted nucleic acid-binding protein
LRLPEERIRALVLAAVRDERFHLIWNQSIRREIEMILRRIPRLDWEEVANLFQRVGEFTSSVDPSNFVLVRDRDDRKFAALSAAAKMPLVTNDNCLLTDLGMGSTRSRRAPSWHERERIPEPGPHFEAGGTIENA